MQATLEQGGEAALQHWLRAELQLDESAARQAAEYAAAQFAGFGMLPSQSRIALERFFDESGGTQLISRRPNRVAYGVSPVYAQSAKGARFIDIDGHEYIDWISGIASIILGYADPVVDEAVRKQIEKGTIYSVNHELEVELAEELCREIPCAEMVRYAKCGGEACAIAVRIARGTTGRDKVLFCGYHGWHDWYLAANLAEEASLNSHLFPGIEATGVPQGLAGTALPFAFGDLSLADHGAGKSYLGFILYDLFLKDKPAGTIHGIETRAELVQRSRELAERLGFPRMHFLDVSVEESTHSGQLPERIDVVTALHACNTATDDAIQFAFAKDARFVVLVPCCQAEVASVLRQNKNASFGKTPLSEIWRHPLHTREFGSQLTNALRCLQLEAHGYQVTVTELVGWEHSMKNELIIARHTGAPRKNAGERIEAILGELNLTELRSRFAC